MACCGQCFFVVVADVPANGLQPATSHFLTASPGRVISGVRTDNRLLMGFLLASLSYGLTGLRAYGLMGFLLAGLSCLLAGLLGLLGSFGLFGAYGLRLPVAG